MLLSKDFNQVVSTATTPLGFLRDQFEFEYLTARIAFLQGLVNWLAAVGVNAWLSDEENRMASQKMNRFMATALFLTIVVMMCFYNNHLTFFHNYGEMLLRWITVSFKGFYWRWPPRPMDVILLPTTFLTLYRGYQAFFTEDNEEAEAEKE